MKRVALALVLLLPALMLTGCEEKGSGIVLNQQDTAACDIDLDNLQGDFFMLKAEPGREYNDHNFRIRFSGEGDDRQAVSTGGPLAPGNPATNKYTYNYLRETTYPNGSRELLYEYDVFDGEAPEKIEELRKNNTNPALKFLGRLYVRFDERRCRLRITDNYVTFLEGEESEDSNMGGTSPYTAASEEESDYSFQHCKWPNLAPYAVAEPGRRDEIKSDWQAGEEVHFIFEPPTELPEGVQGPSALEAEEGCTYSYSMYYQNRPVAGASDIAVEPNDDGDLRWAWSNAGLAGTGQREFVEMHRSQTCAGEQSVIDAVCTVLSVAVTAVPAAEEPAEEGTE